MTGVPVVITGHCPLCWRTSGLSTIVGTMFARGVGNFYRLVPTPAPGSCARGDEWCIDLVHGLMHEAEYLQEEAMVVAWSESMSYLLADSLRSAHGGQHQVARVQRVRVRELVRHARTASPLYRHLYRHLPPEVDDVTQLPVVDKPMLMASFDDWVTDPDVTLEHLKRHFLSDLDAVGERYLGRYLVMTTSGTTGEPAVLLQDRLAWRVINVLGRTRPQPIAKRIDLPALARRGMRTAALFATGGHYGAVTIAERTRRINPVFATRTRVLSVLRPLDDLVAELNEYQPTLISGYPSIIALLASEQRAGRLHLEPLHILCAGELLTQSTREAITGAFHCVLTQGYAATEVPAVAMECANERLHVNSDWFVIEPVDADRQPVPPGVQSTSLLVTNLANHVQPILRYDLGDRVTIHPRMCECGSHLPVMTVEGRTNDVLTLDGDSHEPVAILPLALGSVIEEVPGVHRFQVLGTGPRSLTIRLDVEPGMERPDVQREVEHRVRAFLRGQHVTETAIEWSREAPRPEPRSGKLRQVLQA